MNKKDYLQEFEYLIDALNYAHCIAKSLIKDTNNTILTCNKNPVENHTDIRNLEKFLFYLDFISFQINEMIKDAQNIDFLCTIKKQNFYSLYNNKNNLFILPIYPDEDIYVSSDKNIFDIIKKNNKK